MKSDALINEEPLKLSDEARELDDMPESLNEEQGCALFFGDKLAYMEMVGCFVDEHLPRVMRNIVESFDLRNWTRMRLNIHDGKANSLGIAALQLHSAFTKLQEEVHSIHKTAAATQADTATVTAAQKADQHSVDALKRIGVALAACSSASQELSTVWRRTKTSIEAPKLVCGTFVSARGGTISNGSTCVTFGKEGTSLMGKL